MALGTSPSVTMRLPFAPAHAAPLRPAGIGDVPSLAPGILRNDRAKSIKERSFSPVLATSVRGAFVSSV